MHFHEESAEWWQCYSELEPHLQKLLQVKALLFFKEDKRLLLYAANLFNLEAVNQKGKVTFKLLGAWLEELVHKKLLHPFYEHLTAKVYTDLIEKLLEAKDRSIGQALSMLKDKLQPSKQYNYFFTDKVELCKDLVSLQLLISIFRNDEKTLNTLFQYLEENGIGLYIIYEQLIEIFAVLNFSRQFIEKLFPKLQELIFKAQYYLLFEKPYILDIQKIVSDIFLKQLPPVNSEDSPLFASYAFWLGIPNKKNSYLQTHNLCQKALFESAAAFLLGDFISCIQYYQEAVYHQKAKKGRSSKKLLSSHFDYFYMLALAATNQEEQYAVVLKEHEKYTKKHSQLFELHAYLQALQQVMQGQEPDLAFFKEDKFKELNFLNGFFCILIIYRISPQLFDSHWEQQIEHVAISLYAIVPVLGILYIHLLIKMFPHLQKKYIDKLEAYSSICKINIADSIPLKPKWERALNYLNLLAEGHTVQAKKKRLAWFLDFKHESVEVKEQTISAQGKWTKGRAIKLKRLKELDPSLDYLTEQEQKAMQALKLDNSSYYYYNEYQWDFPQLCYLLTGHPNVYDDKDLATPLELIKGDVILTSQLKENEFLLTISPCQDEPGYCIEHLAAYTYCITPITPADAEVARTIGKEGLYIPKTAEVILSQALQKISPTIKVSADALDIQLPAVDPDNRLHLHVLPFEEGVKLYLWVQPLGGETAYLHPGAGQNIIIGTQDKQSVKTNRNLVQEKAIAREWIEQSPTLLASNSDTYEWEFPTLQEAVQVLSEIQAIEQPLYKILWPKGEKFKVTRPLDASWLSLKIPSTQKEQWFEITGHIQLDKERIVQMSELLEQMDIGG